MCYNAEFGRSTSNHVCISKGESPKLGSSGAKPLRVDCMADLLKTSPSRMCYHAEFCHSALNNIDYIEQYTQHNPKIGKCWCSAPWDRDVADPLKLASPHASDFVVLHQRTYTYRERNPKLASIGALLLLVGASHRMCCPAEFGRSSSNGTMVIREICLKNLTPRVPPFKVTQGHWNRY